MTNLLLKNKLHVKLFEHHISKQIFFSLFFMNHTRKSLSPSRPKNLSLSSSKLKFQTRDQQLLHQNGFKAGLTTNLTPYSTIKSLGVGLRIMMNCRWWLLVTMSGDGGCKVSLVELLLWYRFYFILFYLGFVWVWGVNHVMFDGWNSLGLRKLLGHTMLDDVSFFFFFFFIYNF